MTARMSPPTTGSTPEREETNKPGLVPGDPSNPARILIVDDDPGILMAMETLLEGPNRTIVKVETGQDALRRLLHEDFAVILLDVRMPRMDGYETAALIRQRDRSRYTPIIFLSGVDTMDGDVFRGLASGAVDYLVKPVVPEVLQNKVAVFVDLYHLRERVKQQAVRQTEERFRLLVEGVQEYAIFMLDQKGLVETWTNGAERLTGYRAEDIVGRPYECFYPAEEFASGQAARDLREASSSEKDEARPEQDRWLVRKDGTRFLANVTVAGLREEHRGLRGYAIVIRDVTERRRTQEATAHLAAIVASSSDAIISKDLDGVIKSWNHGAELLFGYTAAEMVGQSIRIVIPDSKQEEEPEILNRIRRGERIEHYETLRKHKCGLQIPVSLTLSPITDQAGHVVGASSIARDITERKRAEASLQQLTSELEQRVQERTGELVLAHERLRALAMQLNLTEQRERQRLATDLHDYLAQLLVVLRMKIRQMARVMTGQGSLLLKEADQIITQSLDYTRSLVAELSPPALHEFGLPEALEWLCSQMQRHGLSIVVNQRVESLSLPEDQSVLLFQSVRELLFNVLKHAGAKQATISVALSGQSELEVTVADNGQGFDAQIVSRQNAESGGFGLFSIRERMAAMGGRLEIRSTPGQGTNAILTTPYWPKAAAEAKATPSQPAPAGSRREPAPSHPSDDRLSDVAKVRVLLVDDHAMVRQGLRSVLEQYPDLAIVGEASDGEEALALAQRVHPDVILMDVTMPKMDGLAATKALVREFPHIIVVGMSVHSDNRVKSEMLEAGAVAFINKEAAVEELYRTIQQVLVSERRVDA